MGEARTNKKPRWSGAKVGNVHDAIMPDRRLWSRRLAKPIRDAKDIIRPAPQPLEPGVKMRTKQRG